MNIQNFQITQGMFRTVEGKSGSGKGTVFAESDPPVPEMNLPQTPEKSSPGMTSLSEKRVDELELFYPPFFPIGDTQSIYSIPTKAVSSDPVEGQKTGMEAVAAERQQVAANEHESIHSNAPDAEETADPGSMLDLKV